MISYSFVCAKLYEILNSNHMQVVSLSDFRQNLREKLDAVVNDADVVVVNRPNNKNVVVISLD